MLGKDNNGSYIYIFPSLKNELQFWHGRKKGHASDTGPSRGPRVCQGCQGLLPWPKAIKRLSLRNEGRRTSWKGGETEDCIFFSSRVLLVFLFFSKCMSLIWNISHCSPGLNPPSYCALLTLHLRRVRGRGHRGVGRGIKEQDLSQSVVGKVERNGKKMDFSGFSRWP